MPELPEVEVVVRTLAPLLLGQTLISSQVHFPHLRYPIQAPLDATYISAIFRRSKYIILKLQSTYTQTHIEQYSIWHLGMSGQWRWYAQNQALQKHEHLSLYFQHGVLRYYDPRRFGAIVLCDGDYQSHALIQNLGREPLLETLLDLAIHWHTHAQRATQNIKTFLMNGRYVVGIGNIYASEILFAANIAPQRLAKNITLLEFQTLAQHTQHILQHAIEQGGSTFKDFMHVDGQKGHFQQAHQVYQKAGLLCPQCCRAHIVHIVQQNRSTYFCPQCQM